MSSIILFIILFFFSSMVISKKVENPKKKKDLILRALIVSMFLSTAVTQTLDDQINRHVNPLEIESQTDYEYGDIDIEEDKDSINNTIDDKTAEEIKEDASDIQEELDIEDNEINQIEEAGKIHFIDVGQGDATLLQSPSNEFVLIDGGTKKDGNKVIAYLKKLGVSELDMVIATHPHEDHIGGLIEVVNQFPIKEFVMPNKTHTTKTFENLLMAIDNKDLKITIPNVGEDIGYIGMPITVLHPDPEEEHNNLNNYSVSVIAEINNKEILLSGDAEVEAESLMVSRFKEDLKADIMKAGHHGSTTSNTDSFLDFVEPDYVVISSGKDNKYGHPHKEIVSKLKNRNIETYNTATHGDVVITIKEDIKVNTKHQ